MILFTILLLLLTVFPFINTFLTRCYLCSQETLPECIGDASLYSSVLQYYTEPCHGQCVLFRNENQSVIRGCSWTYGHMTRKSIGWHDISPGILAYFCDSFLCNNGTYIQPEFYPPKQLVLLASNHPEHAIRQCYVCTERFQGCGEFLDLHYASKYVRTCPTSCVLFRNPNDLNLITRDCSMFWSEAKGKNGLRKLFGTDVFFCQEPLCNGISLDFVLSLYHLQLPKPSIHRRENRLITTTTIYNDDSIWDDPDLDENTTTLSNNSPIETSASFVNFSSTTIEIEKNDSIDLFNTTTTPVSTENQTETWQDVQEKYTVPMMNIFPFFPDQFLDAPLAIPPFAWMINMAEENNQSLVENSTTTTTALVPSAKSSYEYCKNKQCHYDGRLTSDCLCICLPAFTGENCEIVLCDEEPGDICAFILEHECEDAHIRHLCPRYCQLEVCSSTTN